MSEVNNVTNTIDILNAILTDLGIPNNLLDPNAFIYRDLQLNSTEIVEISLGLKRRLGVSIKLESRQDITITQVCQQVETALLASHSNHS
jgi:acyl carrier protein